VQIVPHTWQATTMSRWRQGTLVNLECDIIGKYVARAVALGWAKSLVQQP
jgi:riboflavin synthase